MFTAKTLIVCMGLAPTAVHCLGPNINSKMFDHMLSQFEAEEVAQMEKSQKPVMGGETVHSLDDAIGKVRKLMGINRITQEQGDKLIHSLIAAEQMKKIATVMQLQSKSLSDLKAGI